MKQDAMNDKIKKYKTCEKQCMQEDLDQLRGMEKLSSRPQQIEQLLRGQELFRSIHLVIERCRDCDKKQLKSSIDKLGVEEVLRSYQDYLKTVFQRGKNTDMNAIKHATQPMIQSTF